MLAQMAEHHDFDVHTGQHDFQRLYEVHPEYVERRNPGSYAARRIEYENRLFKIPGLLEVLPPGFEFRSVAEIGCATGELIATFPANKDAERFGFDISPENIRAARGRFPNVDFSTADFRAVGRRFDLVILSDVIEHIPNDSEFLSHAARIANHVLVNLPLERCLTNIFRRYGPEDSSGHLRSYSLGEGLALFDQAGLVIDRWVQRWSYESECERERQRVNRREFGHAFSGSLPSRIAKALAFHAMLHIRPLGHLMLASNLFALVRERAGPR